MAKNLAWCTTALLASLCLINLPDSSQSFRIQSYDQYSDRVNQFTCSESCSTWKSSDQLIEYKTGTTYTYQVQLTTKLNGQQQQQQTTSDTDNQVQIRAIADLSAYGPCEMVLRLRQVQINGIENERQTIDMKTELESHSTHFAVNGGQIEQVCAEQDESEWTVNVKKSIVSSIQMSAKSLTENTSVLETDINGQCVTEYQPVNKWQYGQDKTTVQMIKSKELSKCNNRHQTNLGLFPRSYGLDQLVRSSVPIVNGTYECRQKIQDGIVIESVCYDKQTVWPLKVTIDSDIHCQLIGEQQVLSAPKSSNHSMKRQNLAWNTAYSRKNLLKGSLQTQMNTEYTVEQVEQLLRQICGQVEKSIDYQVPELFAQLVYAKQSLTADDEQRIYSQVLNGQYCTSSKLNDMYLDASALSGTDGSIHVLIQAYETYQQQRQQQKQQQQQYEILPRFSYYFSLLAFTKTPTVEAAQRLVQFLQQQQQQTPLNEEFEQIVYGVTGYVHNLRQFAQDQEQQQQYNNNNQEHVINYSDVEPIVTQLHQQLLAHLGQLAPQLAQQQQQREQRLKYTTVLSLVHGLENVGYELPNNYQQQQQFVKRLVQICQQYSGQSQNEYYTPIRVAIIRSIVNVVDDETIRNYLFELFYDQQQQESNVVRIEAYKTLVMSGAKISELKKIQEYVDSNNEERSVDLVNYVQSHQANLRTTSDIYRRSVLPLGSPKFSKPKSLFGVSRNYEFSYLNDPYQIGVTAEADVIYDRQQRKQQQQTNLIPQMFTFNLTVPIMGREFQVVQVRVHQNGLEQVFKDNNYQQYGQQQQQQFDPIKLMGKVIDAVKQNGRQLFQQYPQFNLYVQVQLDGKTVVVYNEKELISLITGRGILAEMFRDVFTLQQSTLSVDRAFSIIPVDFVTSMTTSTGMPVQIRLNSTVVVGLKADVKFNVDNQDTTDVDLAIWPTFAGQLEGHVQYYAGQQQAKSVQHMVRVYSAPHFNLKVEFDGKQGVSIRSTMPEQKYTVFRYETELFVNKQRTNQKVDLFSSTVHDNNRHQCTEFTKKLLGVALCYDVVYENDDQQNRFVVEVSVEKFDNQLNSFVLQLENPITFMKSITSNKGKRSLKFMFNTPGSQIDRETIFELQLPSFDRQFITTGAKLKIKCPWKEMIAEAIVNNHNNNDRSISVQLSLDQHRYVQMQVGYEIIKRGEKTEYQTKMIFDTPFMTQPINLVGVWSYQQGSKSILHISLEDVQQQRNFIKGTIVKSGRFDENNLKCSAHLMFDLAAIACKTIGTIEQDERNVKIDFSTDYQTETSGRQSARLLIKHQNLSYGKMIKTINQAQWSSSEAPKYNAQYNHRFTYGSNDFLEHDLQMKWNHNEEQIRLFQSVKLAEQRGQYDGEIDAIVMVKPLKINYEIKAQTNLIGFNGNAETKRYELIATGHRRDQPQNDKIHAELSFQQQSSKPLKMNLRAVVKSDRIDFQYTDNIEEEQPNQYHGRMMIQLSPKQKYSTQYVYSIYKQSNEHQLDATINDDITNTIYAKQHGKYQSTPNKSFNVESKWTNEQNENLFDGRLNWDNNNDGGKIQCQFQHYPSDSRGEFELETNSNTKQSKANVEFENRQYKHHSYVDYDQINGQYELNSKTKQNENDLFTIDTKISPKHRSHLAINSKLFNSDCYYEPESECKKSGKIQFHMPGSWQHETQTWFDCDNDRYQLESRTDYDDNTNIYNLNGKYHKNQALNLALKTRSISSELSAEKGKQYRLQFDNNQIKHDTRLNCEEPNSIEFESNTINNGDNVASIHYGCNQDQQHELFVDCNGLVRAKGQCQLQSNEPFVNFNVDYVADEQSPLHHETQFKANRREQTAQFNTNTKLSNKKIAEIQAAIARNPSDQQPYASATIRSPKFDAHIGYEKQINRFDDQDDQHKISCAIDCQQYKHQTNVKILKKRSIVDFESETQFNKENNDYDHQSNSLQVNGQYRHMDKETPSKFNVKLGDILSTIGHINLFNDDEKTFDMQGQHYLNGQKYRHESKIQYLPKQNSMIMDGKISDEIGKKIAAINSFLCTDNDKTSYLKVDSDDKKQVPQIKIELNRRMKRAAVDFDYDQYHHQTMFHNDQSAVKVNTITTKDQQNVFNFNTEINQNPLAKSHFNVKVGPKYETSVHVYPSKRSGAFALMTPAIRHQTEFDLNNQVNGPANLLQSTTHYHDDLLADLDARMEGLRGENVVKANVPGVLRLDTTMDLPGRRFSFDAQTDSRYGGRHAVGSIYATHVRRSTAGMEDRSFHFDLAWDVDRDPRSRVLVDVTAQHQPDHTLKFVARADYAHNKLIFETELTPRSVFAHSARVSLSYVPYGNIDSFQVVYTHLNRLPQVECKLEFLFRGQVRYSARLTTQITDERFVIGIQTTAPQYIDAQVNVNVIGVAQGNGQYYFKGTVQRAVEDQYELEATLEQDPNYQTYYGKLELRVPKSESQTLEYRIDLPARHLSVHTVNPKNGGRFDLEAKVYPDQDMKFSLRSDVSYLPVVDAKVYYTGTNEPEFYSKLDYNQERLFEAQYKITGMELISNGQFHLLARLQSVFTPTYELSCTSGVERQANGHEELVFTVEGKYNAEKVFHGVLKRVSSQSDVYGEQSVVFDMQGWISRPNGVQLLRTASKFVLGGQNTNSALEYMLDIEPNRNEFETFESIYVIMNGARKPQDSNKWIGSIKISKGDERRDMIDADVVIEQGHHFNENVTPFVVNLYGVVFTVPERIVTTVRYVPTSTQWTLQASFMEQLDVDQQRTTTLFDEQTVQPQLRNLRVLRKYRNQFVATLDDKKIGYEVISNKLSYRNTWEHDVRLYSPQSNDRSLRYRTAYHYAPETFTYVYRSELTYGYLTEQPLYRSTQVIAPIPNKPTSYMVHYDLHSPVLGGDGHVYARAFLFGTENKYQGVVATLKTTQNDQLTFEATTRTEEEQANQMVYYHQQSGKTTYYNVTVYTNDHRIDTGFDGYVSGTGFEFNWHNQNRYGNRKTGQCQFRFLDDSRFEAVAEHDNHGLHFRGQLRPKQNVYIIDTVVDHYRKVVTTTTSPLYRIAVQSTHQRQTEKLLVDQYKIHVETKDKCVRADIVRDSTTYRQQQQQQHDGTYSQQLSFCMDDDQSNILNVAIDSIENGQKTTDLNVRLDTREVVNSVILSLKWNPRYYQTYYGQMLQQLQHNLYDQNEMVEEVRHFVKNVLYILYEKQDGFSRYQTLYEQLMQTVEYFFGMDAGQMQQIMNDLIVVPFTSTIDYFYRLEYVYGSVFDKYQQIIRKLEYQCYQSDVCRKTVETLMKTLTTPEQFTSIVSDYLVEALQHTHRFVATSYAGRWIRSLIPSTVFDYLPEFIHHLNYYFVQSYTKLVGGNYPLADFINNLEHVVHEMIVATHWRQVQWHQVKKTIDQMVEFTLTPWRYLTTTRVLVYDPQQGQLQIELYGAAVKHPRYYYEQVVRPLQSSNRQFNYYYNNNQSTNDAYNKGGYYYPVGGQQQQQQQQRSFLSRLFEHNN